MSSHFSKPRLVEMDSILNKELENFGSSAYASLSCSNKENNMGLSSGFDAQRSTSSLAHHSRKNSNAGERSPRVTFKDQYQTNLDEKCEENVKMQKVLINLQAKVLELEMKISSMTSPTIQKNSSVDIRSSIPNLIGASKISSIHVSPLARTKEPELKSSLRSTLDRKHNGTLTLRVSPILEQDQFELSRTLPDDYSGILVRSPSGLSCYTNKSNARKTLKVDDSQKYQSSVLRESTYSMLRSTSRTSLNNTSAKHSKRESRAEVEDERLNLGKQIKMLKKEYDHDRAALVKERVKGKELEEELRKCFKKLNKFEKSLKTATSAQTGYVDLIESYDKSEDIRKQQRRMIEKLNDELRYLKGEEVSKNDELSFEYKAPLTINTKLRTKSKGRMLKAF